MDLKIKTKKLREIYQEFEAKALTYRQAAVCTVGCADCCINVGNVDAVTLEAWRILERLKAMDPGRRSQLKKKIEANARSKTESTYSRCAFLQDNLACAIYPVRPFSCRRLYSLARCGENGPTVHRQVWQLGEETVAALRALDATGCSGHLSQVLLLLQEPRFRKAYLDGDRVDEAIRGFEYAPRLCMNRGCAR